MDAIIKIKQIPDTHAVTTGLDKYNRSRMPYCKDMFQVSEGIDGRYITGIDEDSFEISQIKDKEEREAKIAETKELRLKLEGLLRRDLSATSSFWADFIMEIGTNEDLILNRSNPLDVVKLKALIANGYVAPNKDAASHPKYLSAKYYAHTDEQFEEEKVSTQKLRDKARRALLEMSDNSDKMVLIGQFLEGFVYKRGMKPDTLYSMLSQFIDKNVDNVKAFNKAADTPVEELQYKITVDKAIKSKVIKFKNGQYIRGGVNLGKSLPEVLQTLKSPEYANEFMSIHEEVA